jgi:hypothetical protein
MKKPIKQLLFAGMAIISLQALGQTSKTINTPVITVTNTQAVALTQQNGISVSYQNGSSNGASAMCLIFKNTNNTENDFTWTLKDKNGNIVYASNLIQIGPDQSIDMNNTHNNNCIFAIGLKDGMSPTDYSIEITSK